MKKLLLILSILFTFSANGQVIQFVQQPSQTDIKVKFVEYRYQADVVVMKVDNKYQASKPGHWYFKYSSFSNSGYYSNSTLKVRIVRYHYEADFHVYVTENRWEIKLTDEYLNAIK